MDNLHNIQTNICNHINSKKYSVVLNGLIYVLIYDCKINTINQLFDILLVHLLEQTNEQGYLYCLYNEMFNYYGPNVYKIGCTVDYDKRKNSYVTPYIKRSEYKYISSVIKYHELAEQILFNEMEVYRITHNREFFNCELSIIINKINYVTHKMINNNILQLCKDYKITNPLITTFIKNFNEYISYNSNNLNLLNIHVNTVSHFNTKINETINKNDIVPLRIYNYSKLLNHIDSKSDKNELLQKIIQQNNSSIIYNEKYDSKTTEIINNILDKLGFSLFDMNKIIKSVIFYDNYKKYCLQYIKNNYNVIKKIFNKTTKLDFDLTGSFLTKFLNSLLNYYNLRILCISKSVRNKNKVEKISSFKIILMHEIF
ncbi:hypothetical protein Klosneuvirus_10_6 [Klosneuvirus KNV1]|uniref:Bacteriophage T5 Orf172 DNA-binding domain-containing protein n=1 Tax=Klosneuvirus KNV1 TaxID=1977640 RepID=A0A1V0SLL6_9VIRU|nr:hypothetical protein Klosneuvirus_10_6 [Klosneuvirus KNV1]